jgi:hypothetical protein
MSDILGTNVASAVVPFTTSDTYPSHLAKYGKGGYREVVDITERDGISDDRRSEGMLVYVQSEGLAYQLKDGITNSDWTLFFGTSRFIDLGDTPAAYTGHAGKIVQVNATEDGLEFYSTPKMNYAGAGAPSVDNDITEGYSVGSLWIDITSSPKEAYRCLDAADGAASWVNTTFTADEVSPVSWNAILDKPSTFTPSAHTHVYGDLTDVPLVSKLRYRNDMPSTITENYQIYAGSLYIGGVDADAIACFNFNNALTDLSTQAHVLTNGGATFNATAKFGSYSLRLASTQYLNESNTVKAHDFIPNNKANGWTFEFWINPTTNQSIDRLIQAGTYSDHWYLGIASGVMRLGYFAGSSGAPEFILNNGLQSSVWQHVAISCNSSKVAQIYIDGILQSGTISGVGANSFTLNYNVIPGSSVQFYLGDVVTYSGVYLIDDLRVSKIQRYTTNFTPRTIEYSLTAYEALGLFGKSGDGTIYNLVAPDWDQIQNKPEPSAFDYVDFNNDIATPSHLEGRLFYDRDNKTLSLFTDINSGTSLQIGQEAWIRIYNNTGSIITNGQALSIVGAHTDNTPTVALASAATAELAYAFIGLATHDIGIGAYGYVTRDGYVRGLNTNAYSEGTLLFLSATTPGALALTPASSPGYNVSVGQVIVSDISEGVININSSIGNNTIDVIKIFNGSILEDHVIDVTSNGTTVTLTLQKTGGGDITVFFNGRFYSIDTTPAISVELTAGSDASPTLNYVYIPESTHTLTTSTVGFPAAQHIRVATVLVQSAASAQLYGLYKVHAWTDHLSSGISMGHLADVNYWIRQQNATWQSGCALTPTIVTNAGVPDDVEIAIASGIVLQLHTHSIPVIDTAAGHSVYVVNSTVTPYLRVTDLNGLLTDSLGASMSGRYFNLVIWGSVSEDDEDCQLYINLPNGSYGPPLSTTNAADDINRTANYNIPSSFKGTGFLIARLTFQHSTTNGGTWTLIRNTDLRGLFPITAAGSTSSAQNTTVADNVFRIYDETVSTKQMAFELSSISGYYAYIYCTR